MHQDYPVSFKAIMHLGSHGKFYHLIKSVDKRRENKQNDVKNKEELKELIKELSQKEEEIKFLKLRIEEFKEKIVEQEDNAEMLAKLYEAGIIDENGAPTSNKNESNDMN